MTAAMPLPVSDADDRAADERAQSDVVDTLEPLGDDSGLAGGGSITDWDWGGIPDADDLVYDSWGAGDGGDEYAEFLVSLEDIPDEEAHLSARHAFQESLPDTFRNLPDPRAGRETRLRQAILETISEDDYDDPTERKLVRLMRLRAKAILDGDESATTWLDWFFCFTKDEFGLVFEDCAISLGCDPTAVRMRFQKYFFLRWIVTKGPIGLIMGQPPEEWLSAASYYTGSAIGTTLLRAAWEWPGIPMAELIRAGIAAGYSEKITQMSVAALLERKYLVDWEEAHCYAVGDQGYEVARSNPFR